VPRAHSTSADTSYQIYRLSAVEGDGLDVDSLPFSLKVLLENLLRTEDGADITADDIRALAGWDATPSRTRRSSSRRRA
jgi:aconitate hydratase